MQKIHSKNRDYDEKQFLYQIQKEFFLDSTYEAVKLTCSVLQALRQTLTPESANAFLNALPDFLKMDLKNFNGVSSGLRNDLRLLPSKVTA